MVRTPRLELHPVEARRTQVVVQFRYGSLQRPTVEPGHKSLGVGVGQRALEPRALAVDRGDLVLLGFDVLIDDLLALGPSLGGQPGQRRVPRAASACLGGRDCSSGPCSASGPRPPTS